MTEAAPDPGPPDPCHAVYHVRFATGEQFGPATMDTLEAWAREGRVPPTAFLIPVRDDGSDAGAPPRQPIPVTSIHTLAQIIDPALAVRDPSSSAAARMPGAPVPSTPPTEYDPATGAEPDSPIATLIPYRNPLALAAYYVSVFALIPIVGVILAPIAIALAIAGLVARRRMPQRRGAAHAWVAIVLSLLILAGHILGVVIMMGR
ncbi:MAG: hypothetical protein KF817_06925 [Phycisphaeraceae bacterium]|nr:hypothetical protein [Phycisphaeraceae bacterium]